MKGSLEVKSIKLVDIESFKLNVQLGWVFTLTLVTMALILGVARVAFTQEVQQLYTQQCQQSEERDLAVSKKYNLKHADMLSICKTLRRTDIDIALDVSSWSYDDIYGDNRFKN